MAAGTPFAIEDLLPACGRSIKIVRIWRRLERVDVKRQGVKLLVAIPSMSHKTGAGGISQCFEVRKVRRNESVVAGKIVAPLVHCCVAHQINNGAVLLKSRAVKIMKVFDADHVGHLDGVERIERLPWTINPSCATAGWECR